MRRKPWPLAWTLCRATLAGMLGFMLAALGCSGCGLFATKAQIVNYFIDAKLITYNANTATGRSSGALMAFARVLPGFSYTSPNGGLVADLDIGTAQQQPGQGEEFTVRYDFAPKALWSDGAPMTCDDLVLSWAALSGRLPGAVPASKLGYELISQIQCNKGSKEATAVFDRHFPAWMGLFGPGTILPAHVLAKASGTDVVDALASGDQGQLRGAGAFWSSGWDFGAFGPARFPASGPYRIESVDNGAVTLVRNERWWGRPAQTPRVKIWPKGFKPPVAGVQVIDVGKGSIADLRLPADVREQTVRSLGIEQFVLSTKGPFAAKRGREAFALCQPRAQLADQFGDKAAPAPAPGALADSQDLWHKSAPQPIRYAQPDPAEAYRARDEVSHGQQLVVRVGYLAPDARRAALVQAVAQACAPAGIRVQDGGSADFTPAALAKGQIDVALVSSDLATGAGGGAGPTKSLSSAAQVRSGEGEDVGGYSSSKVDDLITQLAFTDDDDERLQLLGRAQAALWDDVPVIPLFAEPRSVIASTSLRDLVPNASAYGAGWNMDRWSADA